MTDQRPPSGRRRGALVSGHEQALRSPWKLRFKRTHTGSASNAVLPARPLSASVPQHSPEGPRGTFPTAHFVLAAGQVHTLPVPSGWASLIHFRPRRDWTSLGIGYSVHDQPQYVRRCTGASPQAINTADQVHLNAAAGFAHTLQRIHSFGYAERDAGNVPGPRGGPHPEGQGLAQRGPSALRPNAATAPSFVVAQQFGQ